MQRTVSIVIPSYNEERSLPHLFAALRRQTYPSHLVEVIVVDNRSTDRTKEIATAAGATVLQEDRMASSDLARNKAIMHARGDIIAFTDSDCRPEPDWLEKLVAAIPPGKPTLAAGRILMDLPARPDAGGVYDSMSFLNHENSVRHRKIAFTANLAVDRQIALAVGGIPLESVTSGDGYFARRCYHFGCDMVYVPEAVVRHPVRNFRQVCSKVKMIAKASAIAGDKDRDVPVLRGSDYKKGLHSLFTMPHLWALNPWMIRRHLKSRGVESDPLLIAKTWAVAVYVLTLGCLISLRQRVTQSLVNSGQASSLSSL